MINREEYERLLDEVERLRAENKELRKELEKFQLSTARVFE